MGHMQSILSSMGGDEEDKLTAENFNEETGAPDMGNGPLRTNLRHPEQWFEDTSPNPQDFPRLARVFTRRRGRPQACTADDTELQIQAFQSRQQFQSDGSSPGSTHRRFSTPVLAEPRFDEPSSLQTEAEMWRLWSAKDLPLCAPPRGNDQDGSKTEVDCLGGEYDSLMSTCLPQADHEAALEDEESFDEKSTKTPRTSQLHVPPAEGSPAPSASLLVEAMRSALREALVAADEGLSAASEAPVMGANERPNREDVLVLLDWDDTILPTTWLASRPWFRNWIHYKACLSDGELMSVEDREALDEVDQMACEFLREINGLGHPVCVTLAQRPWVQQSMKAFMPRLAVLWEELGVSVHYAVEEHVRKNQWGNWCLKSSGPSLLESTVLEMNLRSTQKRKVMERLLRRFYQTHDKCRAISIGDGLAERNAMKELAWFHESLTESSENQLEVKTIQMLEDPTCSELTTELKVLRQWLPTVVGCNEDVDAVLGH